MDERYKTIIGVRCLATIVELKNKTLQLLSGTVMGGPARDEVMKKIPGRQGHPGPHP